MDGQAEFIWVAVTIPKWFTGTDGLPISALTGPDVDRVNNALPLSQANNQIDSAEN